MKIKELYNAVALLGFETEIDEEATFFPALNTALHTILRMIPQEKRGILAHYPPTALVADSNKMLYGDRVLSYQTEGAKAFYAEISGKGKVVYKNARGEVVNEEPWDNPYGFRVIRHIMADSVTRVDLVAEAKSRLRCLALYNEVSRSEDISEPSHYVSYDLSKVFGDFAELHEQPRVIENGESKRVQDFVIEGARLSLPRDIEGDIEIVYIPAIPNYTVDNIDDELNISSDLIGALKLLIASYVWLDDGQGEKAKYYKSLYNEEIALAVSKHRDLNITRYESVNNW